jgi:hypothetical protein
VKAILFLRAFLSEIFPPKRRIVRLIRPHWHTHDSALLECGHRVVVLNYSLAAQSHARCNRCLR